MITDSLRKKIGFILIVTLVPILISVLLVEVYIRVTKEYVTPDTLRENSLQYESSIFTRHVFPLKEQRITSEGYFINSKGYRGNDFSEKKDNGILRVIVYGGSSVFDQNVPETKDWPHRIEQFLEKSGMTNIEVINAGIPGHASFDSVARLFSEGHSFEPDYVVLYNAWNDLKYFSSEVTLLRLARPWPWARDPRTHYQGVVDRVLSELSQLYVRLRFRYYAWRYNILSEGVIPIGGTNRKVREANLKQYRLNIEMFVDLARNIDAVPILVTQARLVTADNSDEEKEHIGYDYVGMKHETLVYAFNKSDEIIKDVAHSKHVLVVDASNKLSGKAENFTDAVHLTDKGSFKLAQFIAETLLYLVKAKNDDSSDGGRPPVF